MKKLMNDAKQFVPEMMKGIIFFIFSFLWFLTKDFMQQVIF